MCAAGTDASITPSSHRMACQSRYSRGDDACRSRPLVEVVNKLEAAARIAHHPQIYKIFDRIKQGFPSPLAIRNTVILGRDKCLAHCCFMGDPIGICETFQFVGQITPGARNAEARGCGSVVSVLAETPQTSTPAPEPPSGTPRYGPLRLQNLLRSAGTVNSIP